MFKIANCRGNAETTESKEHHYAGSF